MIRAYKVLSFLNKSRTLSREILHTCSPANTLECVESRFGTLYSSPIDFYSCQSEERQVLFTRWNGIKPSRGVAFDPVKGLPRDEIVSWSNRVPLGTRDRYLFRYKSNLLTSYLYKRMSKNALTFGECAIFGLIDIKSDFAKPNLLGPLLRPCRLKPTACSSDKFKWSCPRFQRTWAIGLVYFQFHPLIPCTDRDIIEPYIGPFRRGRFRELWSFKKCPSRVALRVFMKHVLGGRIPYANMWGNYSPRLMKCPAFRYFITKPRLVKKVLHRGLRGLEWQPPRSRCTHRNTQGIPVLS